MPKRKGRAEDPGSFLRFLRGFISLVMALGILSALAAGGILYWELSSSLPSMNRITEYRPPVVTQVLAEDGSLIAEFFSEKRYLVPIERIPASVRNAFLAAEDDAFYRHRGFDPLSILRALVSNIVAGGKVQGGSTITQQVVKMLLLSPKKSYERKLKEMILAYRLEKQLSKDEILSLYLNHIYLGSGAYGIAAASREYFGKEVEYLSVAEAAILAGLPQAPSRYSPFRNWPEAKARQRYVINRMFEVGYINREQRDEALRQPVALGTRKGNFLAAPHFVEHVRRMLEDRYGQTGLYELGLRVQTTVNVAMQRAAETALRAGLEDLSSRRNGYRSIFRNMPPEERDAFVRAQRQLLEGATLERSSSYEGIVRAVNGPTAQVDVGPFQGPLTVEPGTAPLRLDDLIRVKLAEPDPGAPGLRFVLDPSPPVEGAVVALDPRTGYVRAMVGGYDFDRSQFNRAVQAKRQPGSSFKPLIYAAALDRGFTPATVVVDEEISYWDNGHLWSPKNFENKHYGPTTVREALTFSRNVVTVRMTERMGVKYLVKYLDNFGLEGPFAANLSIALGSAEVTPLELATAYATLANGGRRPAPIFITKVTDAHGDVVESHSPQLVEAIPPQTAYQVTSMLQDVVRRGTGKKADGLGRPQAGKTGTTNDFHDNWFVGYTPQLLAAVWIGFDNKQPLGDKETGGRNAAPIWKAFMEVAMKDAPVEDFPIPDGLTCVNINAESGERALAAENSRLECFQQGKEPAAPHPHEPPLVQPALHQAPAEPSVGDFLRNDF